MEFLVWEVSEDFFPPFVLPNQDLGIHEDGCDWCQLMMMRRRRRKRKLIH